jgi:hypothetical protein
MDLTTTHDDHAALARIFDLADVPQAAPATALTALPDELPPLIEAEAQQAAKRAFHLARAEGASMNEAKEKAKEAFEARAMAMLHAIDETPAPAAPEVSSRIEWTEAKVAPPALTPPVFTTHVHAMEPQPAPAPRPRPIPTPRPTPKPQTPPLPNRSEERVMDGGIDVTGAARSNVDREAARAAGFAPAEPYYRVGTPVIEMGVANARKSRLEHDKLPTVREACQRVIDKIVAEERHEVEVLAADLGMREDGKLLVNGRAYELTRPAFSGLTTRLGYGGAQYLAKCPSELRAHNVNTWRELLTEREAAEQKAVEARRAAGDTKATYEAQKLAMRVRTRAAAPERGDGGGKEIFAAVSPGYTAFDADKICQAIAKASPADARAAITYDGENARMLARVQFHSDVRPQNYVAGEFFKAAVSVRTDDTGGGSIVVSSMVFQNLCLNLICIDRAGQVVARIRHVGNVYELAKKLEAAYKKALESLNHFLVQWGYACEENVVERARSTAETEIPQGELALPGLFNGILDAGLVTLPRLGTEKARRDSIDKLCDLWEGDRSSARVRPYVTRASIANAFTAFARDLDAEDPWAAEEIQREAGALLQPRTARGTEPAPLPYLDLEAEPKSAPQAAKTR